MISYYIIEAPVRKCNTSQSFVCFGVDVDIETSVPRGSTRDATMLTGLASLSATFPPQNTNGEQRGKRVISAHVNICRVPPATTYYYYCSDYYGVIIGSWCDELASGLKQR